ncbi:MAG: AMP-binding protein [Acutalibacteraceae bacterium]
MCRSICLIRRRPSIRWSKAATERNPKLPAYEFMGKRRPSREFMQKIDETAQAFLAMGIKKGDRVTICMPNCPQSPARVLWPEPHWCSVQHDPSAFRCGGDQVLSQFLAFQVHPHA